MSRPRFLADNDLNDAIAVGVLRREPAAEFARLRDLGLATRSDPEVLEIAEEFVSSLRPVVGSVWLIERREPPGWRHESAGKSAGGDRLKRNGS